MWNLRLRETELSKITQKAGDPIKSKGVWLQNASLMVEVQTPCQDCCLLNGSSVVCFSASFQIILPFFMLQLLFLHGYAGDLEKAGTQLCSYCLAPYVGCTSVSHLPIIILSSRDRVMAPGRGLFHQSSQLLMSFMLLLCPRLPSHPPPQIS